MSDDVKGSEDAVAAQARMFDTPGTPWYAVSKGKLEDIIEIWPATACCRPHHAEVSLTNPCSVCGCTADVFARGPVGENVLHLAVLFHTPESVKMAKYLIKRFGPSLLNAPYQTRRTTTSDPGLYEGEVALHIAIVHKDLDLVQFMLMHGARLDVHTIGAFFGPGRVYFGETPFAFAASMGDKAIVTALLDHAQLSGGEKKKLETMTAVDAFGNTGLHVCVSNNQLEMHDFLVDEWGFPEDVRNNAGMTPFILAAHEGNASAFSSILRRRFSIVWKYGPVTNYSLSLADIDTVSSDPHAHDSSVIDVILKKNHLQLLNHPILVAVLDMKWNAFGRRAFQKSILFYVIFLGFFTWQVDLHATKRSSIHEWHSPTRTAVEWVTFVLSLLMLAQHARDLAYFTRAYYRQLDTLRVNSSDAEMPLYCLPGSVIDRRTNRMQLPRALRVVTPRRGTTFQKIGSVVQRAKSSVERWEHAHYDNNAVGSPETKVSHLSASSVSDNENSDEDGFGVHGDGIRVSVDHGQRVSVDKTLGRKLRKSKTKTHRPKASISIKLLKTFAEDNSGANSNDAVYVLASSVNARRRWRILREHWMMKQPCVGLHQIARQMALQHCDDYDDGVTVLLHVNVLEARGLQAADVDGIADPYCVVTACAGSRLRTKCCPKTLSPVWGQAFSFTAPPGIRRSANKITLTVVDHDDLDFDDEMAVACVPYSDVPYIAPGMIPPGPVWLDLESKKTQGSSGLSVNEGQLAITEPMKRLEQIGRDARNGGLNNSEDNTDASENIPKLGQVLVEVYYEVKGLEVGGSSLAANTGLSGTVSNTVSSDTLTASASVSAFTDAASEAKTASAVKARHTAFLRGVGAANQERATRRRLGRYGYTPLDDFSNSFAEKSKRNEKRNDSDSGSDSASDAEEVLTPESAPEGTEGSLLTKSKSSKEKDDEAFAGGRGKAESQTKGVKKRRGVKRFFNSAKTKLRHARGALLFYVTSVLLPQPSLFMNLTHIVLQTTHFVMWQASVLNNQGPSPGDDVVFAVAALAAWGFTLYFAAGYRAVGFLTVIVVQCIKDVIRFSSLWCVVLFAFSQAFYILDASWIDSVGGAENLSNVGDILWRLFSVATTVNPFDDIFPETDTADLNLKTVYMFLGLVFQVLMSMLMLNVIIAMFNQTYVRVSAMAHEQWRMQWALKILLSEAQLANHTRFALRLGEDAIGKNGEKTRVHNFEINARTLNNLEEGSIEEAVTSLLEKKGKK